MMLSREQLRTQVHLRTEDVSVPEWAPEGVDPASVLVRVKGLDGRERGRLMAALAELDEEGRRENFQLYWCAAALIGAEGNPLFGLDGIGLLARQDSRALDRVFEAVDRLNAVTDRALRELEKNSAPTTNGSSGSS